MDIESNIRRTVEQYAKDNGYFPSRVVLNSYDARMLNNQIAMRTACLRTRPKRFHDNVMHFVDIPIDVEPE